METHIATKPGSGADGPVPLPQSETKLLPPPRAEVSDEEFGEVVRGALEAVGGTLLFKVRVGAEDAAMHVAAAAVGNDAARQFLLLSLPIHGGQLKVETAQRSANPLAGIAASYAGLMDAFRAAA